MFVSVYTLCVTPVSVCIQFSENIYAYLLHTQANLNASPQNLPISCTHSILHMYVYMKSVDWVQQTNTPNHAYHSSLVCNLTLKASKRKRALCQSHPVPTLLLSLLHLHSTLCVCVCSKKKFFFSVLLSLILGFLFFFFCTNKFATPRLIPF